VNADAVPETSTHVAAAVFQAALGMLAGRSPWQPAEAHLMSTAHLPTTANDGFRTHGLTADRGHAESEKQMAPSRLANEITEGITTSTMKNAPTNAAKRGPRAVTFVILPSIPLSSGATDPIRVRR
jgi:hypothetical protein